MKYSRNLLKVINISKMAFLLRLAATLLLLCQVFGFAFRIGAERFGRFKRSKPVQATIERKEENKESDSAFNTLKNPWLNKGTSYTQSERKHLQIEGLIPCGEPIPLDMKVEFAMDQLRKKTSPLEKYIYLHTIQDSDETLFYAILGKHTAETMPLVYTPTVGTACVEWSHIYRETPRGIYLGLQHLGRVKEVLSHHPQKDVKVIVFTDGERILGLGDLGSNGMGIPIGKLALYTTCAGIAPHQCLPVMIDVGTNTQSILDDPAYLGARHTRHRGAEYDQLIQEFITASQELYGREVLLQFEDFGNSNAFRLLEEYREKATCFNDDIQGTASVVVAGLKAALRLVNIENQRQGITTPTHLKDQRYLFYGAGEAGIGIADLLTHAMLLEQTSTLSPEEKHALMNNLEAQKRVLEQLRKQCWFVDSQGLITSDRLLSLPQTGEKNDDLTPGEKTHSATGQKTTQRPLEAHKVSYAHDLQDLGDIAEHVHSVDFTTTPSTLSPSLDLVRPHVLIGVSAQGGAFTPDILTKMSSYSSLPQVFALSNPTSKAECTAEQAYTTLQGKVVFASGSPFDPVFLGHNNVKKVPGQGNNAYIFPGVGLGALVAGAKTITDEDFLVAADTLASLVTDERLVQEGCVYPPLNEIRRVSHQIAAKVAEKIVSDGRSLKNDWGMDVKDVDWMKKCEEVMYTPKY